MTKASLNTYRIRAAGAVRGGSRVVPAAGILGRASRFRDGPLGRASSPPPTSPACCRWRTPRSWWSPAAGSCRRCRSRRGHGRACRPTEDGSAAAARPRSGRHRRGQRAGVGGDFGRRRRGDRHRRPAARRGSPRAPAGRVARVPFAVDGPDDRRIRHALPRSRRRARPRIPIVSNLTGQLRGRLRLRRPTGSGTSARPCGSPTVSGSRTPRVRPDSSKSGRAAG